MLKIDRFSKKQLPDPEIKYLPSPEEITEKKKLGKTVFSSIRRVIWRSICDPNSEIYKAWYNGGMMAVLDKKYITTAVCATFLDLSIGIKALAVSATALIIKAGLEVFCDTYQPTGVMIR